MNLTIIILNSLSNQLNSQERSDVEAAIRDFNQKLSGCIKIRWDSSQTVIIIYFNKKILII